MVSSHTRLQASTSASGANNQHVPRPQNCFLCFRNSERCREIERSIKGISARSAAASAAWRGLSPLERAQFEAEAARKKREHEIMFPDYKYSPRRSSASKRKLSSKKKPKAAHAPAGPTVTGPLINSSFPLEEMYRHFGESLDDSFVFPETDNLQSLSNFDSLLLPPDNSLLFPAPTEFPDYSLPGGFGFPYFIM